VSRLQVKVKPLHPIAEENALSYATDHSAGLDLRACLAEKSASVDAGDRLAVGTGIAIEIQAPNMAGFVFSRSGLGTKTGLVVCQGVGVIDPDYRGEIIVSLLNVSQGRQTIQRGQRIAQLLFMPAYQAEILPVRELGQTARDDGGFGHSGEL
jgi:dUTP pyrophosphatase